MAILMTDVVSASSAVITSNAACPRATNTKLAPSLAKVRAVAAPTPAEAPVIMTVLLLKLYFITLYLFYLSSDFTCFKDARKYFVTEHHVNKVLK